MRSVLDPKNIINKTYTEQYICEPLCNIEELKDKHVSSVNVSDNKPSFDNVAFSSLNSLHFSSKAFTQTQTHKMYT